MADDSSAPVPGTDPSRPVAGPCRRGRAGADRSSPGAGLCGPRWGQRTRPPPPAWHGIDSFWIAWYWLILHSIVLTHSGYFMFGFPFPNHMSKAACRKRRVYRMMAYERILD